jgi:hypothetical protein
MSGFAPGGVGEQVALYGFRCQRMASQEKPDIQGVGKVAGIRNASAVGYWEWKNQPSTLDSLGRAMLK